MQNSEFNPSPRMITGSIAAARVWKREIQSTGRGAICPDSHPHTAHPTARIGSASLRILPDYQRQRMWIWGRISRRRAYLQDFNESGTARAVPRLTADVHVRYRTCAISSGQLLRVLVQVNRFHMLSGLARMGMEKCQRSVICGFRSEEQPPYVYMSHVEVDVDVEVKAGVKLHFICGKFRFMKHVQLVSPRVRTHYEPARSVMDDESIWHPHKLRLGKYQIEISQQAAVSPDRGELIAPRTTTTTASVLLSSPSACAH
ncbi:hypothetical protein DFH09DRAFT_1087268 [Mycena vulgaris]|nr:hypothetical protein DFH09DRAFT_1087268 [Mycena vulgaris]